MSELSEIRDRLDALMVKVDAIAAKQAAPRIEYSRKEFAAITGRSPNTLRHPRHWRALGGKKRGRRVVFSAAAVQAIAEGRR